MICAASLLIVLFDVPARLCDGARLFSSRHSHLRLLSHGRRTRKICLPWPICRGGNCYRDEELQKLIRIALEGEQRSQAGGRQHRGISGAAVRGANGLCPSIERDSQLRRLVRTEEVSFPGFPNPFNYYVSGNLCPGNWISGDGSAGRMRRRLADLLARRRIDEPSFCKSSAEWRRPISIFGNSTCSWISPSARCSPGRSR